MTSKELYNYVMEELGTIDCEKVRYKYRTGGEKWLTNISRSIVKIRFWQTIGWKQTSRRGTAVPKPEYSL